MAGRKVLPPRPAAGVLAPAVTDVSTQRAFDVLTDSVQRLQGRRERDVITTDLVIGTNRVRHKLGRACVGYALTPTVADATFAHAIDSTNPRPDLEVWVIVVGAAQLDAILEVF